MNHGLTVAEAASRKEVLKRGSRTYVSGDTGRLT
ncbi:hypothetical protein MITS9509_03482 [Synechococcus sp. MIT S9509]|nr:hypothetical protein MITS9504_03478 [Synechococcus sp. MIT S9504]KZR86511.1 hypothetical protein MITS9509_03482 [Synechococcus sp. MIT S9509]